MFLYIFFKCLKYFKCFTHCTHVNNSEFYLQMNGGSRGNYGKWQNTSLSSRGCQISLMYKWSTKRAAESHGVPRSTLQRYLKQCRIDGSVEKKTMGRQCTMTEQEESELCSILLEMESKLFQKHQSHQRCSRRASLLLNHHHHQRRQCLKLQPVEGNSKRSSPSQNRRLDHQSQTCKQLR